MNVDWNEVRREFPALENWTYLNTATFGQLPRRGVEAVARHFAHRDELACWDFLTWYDDADRLRAKIARLIQCAADDIAFVPNATTALGILLSGIDWRAGDQILTLEHEFPNNLYAPSMLGRFGVEMMECPWEKLCGTVNERTRLVLDQFRELQHRVCATVGSIVRVPEVARRAAVCRRDAERRRAPL